MVISEQLNLTQEQKSDNLINLLMPSEYFVNPRFTASKLQEWPLKWDGVKVWSTGIQRGSAARLDGRSNEYVKLQSKLS